jgi:hypothetical protein
VIADKPGSFNARTPMSVSVTLPSLHELTLSGAGTINVDGITGDRLVVAVPGSGLVRVVGQVRRLVVALSGTGDAQLEELPAAGVRATISGSGRIAVTARRRLVAAVTGTGSITYGGDPPLVTKVVTGTGSIAPR